MSDKGKPKPETATAFLASNEEESAHVVGIGNLRVLITEDEGAWLARGLEIDYFAEGDSLASAQAAFADGLKATIKQHLMLYQSIQKLLVPAPVDVWKELFAATDDCKHTLTHVSFHAVPFSGIAFYTRAA